MTSKVLVQEALQKGDYTLDQLRTDWGLRIKQHPRYPSLYHFMYTRESDLGSPMVRQCRGLILDSSKGWQIVARPLDKFFNHDDQNAPSIIWNKDILIQEKADGTLVYMYYYDSTWQYGTLQSPDASETVQIPSQPTVRTYFEKTLYDNGHVPPTSAFQACTFCFELITPDIRRVVFYKRPEIRLICVRDCDSGEENRGLSQRFPRVRVFDYPGMDSIMSSFTTTSPTDFEGFVITDMKMNRVKVQHPKYTWLIGLRDNMTLRRLVDIVRKGEQQELKTYFPEWMRLITIVQGSYMDLAKRIGESWSEVKDIGADIRESNPAEAQRLFATAIKDLKYKGCLFALRHGTVEHQIEYLKTQPLDTVITMMEVERVQQGTVKRPGLWEVQRESACQLASGFNCRDKPCPSCQSPVKGQSAAKAFEGVGQRDIFY